MSCKRLDGDHEFRRGDAVLCLTDGDVGLVTDICGGDEPYYIEWELKPEDTGWHPVRHWNTGELILVPLGV